MIRATSMLIAMLAAPAVALACPVCGLASTGDNQSSYVSMSVMLSALPLGMIAGMLHEIQVRHTAFVFKERRPVSKADYEKVMRSYRRLMEFMRSGDGAAAEAHWRKHLDTTRNLLLKGLEAVKVRDVVG